jgi:hypothetical protein
VALGLDKMMSSFDGHTLMSCGFYFILFYFIYLFLARLGLELRAYACQLGTPQVEPLGQP